MSRGPYRQELTPLSFLERARIAYAERTAIVDGANAYSWPDCYDRSRRCAVALQRAGVATGDRVAFVALNSEALLVAHYAVPWAGGVLVAINTRLAADEIAWIVAHSGARLVFYSRELAAAVERIDARVRRIELETEWESFVTQHDGQGLLPTVENEYDTISINYTSGTTGQPKGVMYHHRGAYLNALAMALEHRLTADSVYLWTLPMFHCNGWTFTWSVSAVGAESLIIPRIDVALIWRLLRERVTHFCAAPTVLTMLANHAEAAALTRSVRVFTAGAPPSPTLVARMRQLNFELDHVYGLTESYGPFTFNVAKPSYEDRTSEEQASLIARQGIPNTIAGEMRVVDDRQVDVPMDGETMGEVLLRGNAIMKGYYADDVATQQAFSGGWFHTGDLGVVHADGYLELRDRKKDIIISGGENISTIEVEKAIASHPAVLECAVIGVPDEQWGEVPKAFVTLKSGQTATADEVISHCQSLIARFKAPRHVEFCELPKTSTGKVRKNALREREWSGFEKRIN